MRIVLCGSVRFRLWFELINEALQARGHTVDSLSLWGTGLYGYIDDHDKLKPTLEQSHREKISTADAIYVVDVHKDIDPAYIGHSTQVEIEYAQELSKKVYYFSRNDLHVRDEIIKAVLHA